MLELGDLAFPGAAAAAALLLALLLLRRWNLSAARREEVIRLARLAAQEAALAEKEAILAYASQSIHAASDEIGRPRCAVCYSSTTTRCSRCKAVRYCSGKCQIIHWRQGHKDDCRPPQFDDLADDPVNSSNSGGQSAEQSDLCDNLGISEKLFAKLSVPVSEWSCSSELFSKDGNLEENPDTFGSQSTANRSTMSAVSSPLPGFSIISGTEETDNNAPVHVKPPSNDNKKLQGHLSCGSYPDCQENPIADCEKPFSSEYCSASVTANSINCSAEAECINIMPGGSTPKPGVMTVEASDQARGCQSAIRASSTACTGDARLINYGASYKGEISHMDVCSSSKMFSKFSVQAANLCRENGNELLKNVASEPCNTSQPQSRETVDTERSILIADKKIRVSKGSEYLSSSFAGAANGVHSVSNDSYQNADKPSVVPMKTSESKLVPVSCGHDLKTSVKSVFQQCKSFKVSSHYISGFTDVSGKHNYQMRFSYELFIKLYNSDKVELNPCGLINCGNSCYANVVLQCLAYTRPLTAYLLEGIHTKTCPKPGWCFMCEFETLIQKMKLTRSSLSPASILSHVQNIGSTLDRGRQEDAHEFLRCTIDAMQSACQKEAGNNAAQFTYEETSLVHLIFGGYLRSKIKCMRCQGRSEHRERMMDLTVEVHGDIGSLDEALARFTATEVLDGDNKYHCNRCKSYERAKKKLTVLEAPNVLTIALKRFQSGKFGKLNKAVQFPEYLNLAPYMSRTDDNSPVYRLYAVVEHINVMNAAFSGHYVCYVQSVPGKWYKIDDSEVKAMEPEIVMSRGAYMLFYARCLPRAPSLLRKARNGGLRVPSEGVEKDVLAGASNPALANMAVPTHHDKGDYKHHKPSADAFSAFREHHDPLLPERFYCSGADSVSSNDNSSLFSSSEEGSWSTESARVSTSTEEFSDYIFGGSSRSNSWNSSPYRYLDDSDGICSPSSKHSSDGASTSGSAYTAQGGGFTEKGITYEEGGWVAIDGEERPPGKSIDGFGGEPGTRFPAEHTKLCRHMREHCSYCISSRSRDANWVNPGGGRTARTFY